MSSGQEPPVKNATETGGALTKAASRLRKQAAQARLPGAAGDAAEKKEQICADGKRHGGRGRPAVARYNLPGPQDQDRIAVMKAGGLSTNAVSKALGINKNSVVRALQDPGVVGQIAVYRERLRGVNLAAASAIVGKAWEETENALNDGDRKGFDAMSRGLLNMEKLGASASGENQRMEVTHNGHVVNEPIKIQLQQLIALVRNEST